MRKKLIIAITGASGSIYAKVLLDKLTAYQDQYQELGVVMSGNAKDVWFYELGDESYKQYGVPIYGKQDFTAPFASGSAGYTDMIICPCSMGTLGRIANGLSDDLITRAADVILKERRNLTLLLRDTPYNLLHIKNMQAVTEAGGIVCPASPSFYSKPATFEDLAHTVIDRVIDLAGFDQQTYRWGYTE
jgi:4-hydroxy-3-polyprenylbenzoate decarboxylase